MAIDKDIHAVTRDNANRTRDAVDDTARVAESTTRKAADAARRITDDSADAGRTAVERGAETIRDTTRNLSGAAASVTNQTEGQVNRLLGLTAETGGEAVQQTQRNMDVLLQCGTVMMDGMQKIWREWLQLGQESMERRMDAYSKLLRTSNPQTAYAVQSQLLQDEVASALNRSVRIAHMAAEVADTAANRIKRHERSEAGGTRR